VFPFLSKRGVDFEAEEQRGKSTARNNRPEFQVDGY